MSAHQLKTLTDAPIIFCRLLDNEDVKRALAAAKADRSKLGDLVTALQNGTMALAAAACRLASHNFTMANLGVLYQVGIDHPLDQLVLTDPCTWRASMVALDMATHMVKFVRRQLTKYRRSFISYQR